MNKQASGSAPVWSRNSFPSFLRDFRELIQFHPSYECGHSEATRPIIRIIPECFMSFRTLAPVSEEPSKVDLPPSRSILDVCRS